MFTTPLDDFSVDIGPARGLLSEGGADLVFRVSLGLGKPFDPTEKHRKEERLTEHTLVTLQGGCGLQRPEASIVSCPFIADSREGLACHRESVKEVV
jgi:hypothetical protein